MQSVQITVVMGLCKAQQPFKVSNVGVYSDCYYTAAAGFMSATHYILVKSQRIWAWDFGISF